jgi:adenosylcobinamide-phosphate synthase
MSFLVLIAALLLAHYRPLPLAFDVMRWHGPYARLLERNLNDGHARHGAIAWVLSAFLPALLFGVAYWLLKHFALSLAAPLAMLVLYLLLDFRGFGVTAEAIASDLKNDNLPGARARVSLTLGLNAEPFGVPEISRVTIEHTLTRAHYALFAPAFWFILLGPAGALLYRLAQSTKQAWAGQETDFTRVSHRVFYWLDWLPSRFTAIGFAVVGDFEDALFCWRTQAAQWKDEAIGIMLASGAGALGVRLGEPLPLNGTMEYRPELGLGDPADADYVMSTAGLIWRTLVLMLALMLLMTFANWLGS